MTLEDIKRNYAELNLERQRIQDKIDQRERQIYRLENKKERLMKKSWWGDVLIRPIMELVKAEFPQLTWDSERLVPMGMCNRVSIFAHMEGETVAMIGFTPSVDGVNYDVSSRRGDYMSDPNGFSIKSEPITDIKDLFKHIEKQLEKKGELN